MSMFYPSIESESKAKGIVEFIIKEGFVTLPELLKLRINGEKIASPSTHISDGRNHARKLGYRIINISDMKIEGKKRTFISSYIAEKIGNKN